MALIGNTPNSLKKPVGNNNLLEVVEELSMVEGKDHIPIVEEMMREIFLISSLRCSEIVELLEVVGGKHNLKGKIIEQPWN